MVCIAIVGSRQLNCIQLRPGVKSAWFFLKYFTKIAIRICLQNLYKNYHLVLYDQIKIILQSNVFKSNHQICVVLITVPYNLYAYVFITNTRF